MAGRVRPEQEEEGDSGAELAGDAGIGAGAAKVSGVGYTSDEHKARGLYFPNSKTSPLIPFPARH